MQFAIRIKFIVINSNSMSSKSVLHCMPVTRTFMQIKSTVFFLMVRQCHLFICGMQHIFETQTVNLVMK